MIFPIFIIVGISLATAIALDYLKNLGLDFFNIYVLLSLLFVLGLNGFKFIVWTFLHKRYDLSSTYPMTAIYFPIIYAISVLKGEVNIDIISLTAITSIFIGVYLIFKAEKQEDIVV